MKKLVWLMAVAMLISGIGINSAVARKQHTCRLQCLMRLSIPANCNLCLEPSLYPPTSACFTKTGLCNETLSPMRSNNRWR
jgi:hypothetical protein